MDLIIDVCVAEEIESANNNLAAICLDCNWQLVRETHPT